MTRCSACPADPGTVCIRHATGHARFCDWATRDEAHREYIRRNSHAGTQVPVAGAVASRLSPTRGNRPDHVLLSAYLSSWQGYGQHAEWIARGMEASGHRVDMIDLGTDTRWIGRDPWVEERIVEPSSTAPWSIVLAVPFHPTPVGRVVRYTMWETSRISARSVEELNKAALVIVPSRHNAEAFRASGVTVPIEVVPSGIDPAVYRDDGMPLPADRVVFGMAGRMAHGGIRKGINEGMAAFVAAFDRSVADVELRVKVFEDCMPALRIPDDPRITISTRAMRPAEMAAWYRGISCLLVPSKGEGWGFHTHQAMACGRPVIAAPWSGTVEFWDETCGWPIDYDLAPAGEFYVTPGAVWAVPRHDSMVARLREAHADRDGLKARGKAAAGRAAGFTWDRMSRELDAALRHHEFLATSPLQRVALCPHRGSVLSHTLQPECGCAELTECRAMKGRIAGRVTLKECLECRERPALIGVQGA